MSSHLPTCCLNRCQEHAIATPEHDAAIECREQEREVGQDVEAVGDVEDLLCVSKVVVAGILEERPSKCVRGDVSKAQSATTYLRDGANAEHGTSHHNPDGDQHQTSV
jgi:hypothetical protein